MQEKQGGIIQTLKRRIANGDYPERLPTSLELAAEFQVNVKTLHKALAHLVAEGLVVRKRRGGTRIRRDVLPENRLIEVVFEGFTGIFNHPFWGEIWEGMAGELLNFGYRPVLHRLTGNRESGVLVLDGFSLTPAAGVIVLGIAEKRLLDAVAASGMPFIAGCDRINDARVPQISFDFTRAMAEAVGQLFHQGCRRIGFLGQTRNYISLGYLHKFEAYCNAIQRYTALDPALLANVSPLPEVAPLAVRELLARGKPDALIVAYDHQLPEVMAELNALGVSLPIVGCDGVNLPELPRDRLEIVVPRRKCGELLARHLLEAIRQKTLPQSRQLNAVFYS